MQGNEQIPGADVRWRQYRDHMTEYILSNCTKGNRILILGAGSCDDIDLLTMAEQASLICLADVNRRAMEAAVGRVQSIRPELQSRLLILETDFLPISTEEYQEYDKACRSGIRELERWWEHYFARKSVRQKRPDETGKKFLDMLSGVGTVLQEQGLDCFDMVVCLGLHSQLYVNLAVRTFQMKTELSVSLRQKAVDLLQEASWKMAEQFMQEVLKIGKQVILGLEYTTIYFDSAISQEEIRQQLMQYGTKGLDRLHLPRVEGAYQVERQIGDLYSCQRIQLKDRQYLFWPFSEEKSYLMVVYRILES